MIEDLRFVEKIVCVDPDLIIDRPYQKRKILQAYDGYVWFDVPLVIEPTQRMKGEDDVRG